MEQSAWSYTVLSNGGADFIRQVGIPLCGALQQSFPEHDGRAPEEHCKPTSPVHVQSHAVAIGASGLIDALFGILVFLSAWGAKRFLDDVYEIKVRPHVRKLLGKPPEEQGLLPTKRCGFLLGIWHEPAKAQCNTPTREVDLSAPPACIVGEGRNAATTSPRVGIGSCADGRGVQNVHEHAKRRARILETSKCRPSRHRRVLIHLVIVAIWRIVEDGLHALEETRLSEEGVRERDDLQRLLRENVAVVSPDTLVIAEEYGEWTEGRRRIDLLGVDTDANLVVIELKRTESGGHMELQAIRYAAMVSTMTFGKAVSTFQSYLDGFGREEEAESLLLEFLGWDEAHEDAFAQDVRIVLASAEFSKELTTSVIWLNERGLDIRCVRMKPYRLGEQLLLDVQQVVPLPEAADYQVQVREKAEEKRLARKSNADFTRYDVSVAGEVHRHQWKRGMILKVVRAAITRGVAPEQISELLPRGASRFVSLDGSCGAEEFANRFETLRSPRGTQYDARRYFTGQDDLIEFNGRTYAFSNQWGGKGVFKALKTLAENFPDLRIEWTKSATAESASDG